MAQDHLSTTFAALANPTRGAILAHLASSEASLTELSQPFEMSLVAILKHLKVLENAGLTSRGCDAPWRPSRLAADRLKDSAEWLEDNRRCWEESLDRLADYLREMQKEEKKNGLSK